MDEPTSALSREEIERLFSIIEKLKKRGLAIVYISHHLPEIFRIADRVTVMRDGRKVDTRALSEVSREEIVQMMVGRSVKDFYKRREHVIGDTGLDVRNLTRNGFFHDVNFEVKRGEILGICGLSGAGRSELARVLCGLDQADSGIIELEGEVLKPSGMGPRMAAGIGYLTEDRKYEGLALRVAMDDNILVSVLPTLTSRGIYHKSEGTARVDELISELSIYPPVPDRTVANLSGGNQQKVVFSKCLFANADMLMLDEPTRGVDVGAKSEIYQIIRELAEEGKSIMIFSSELPEIVNMCDSIYLLFEGELKCRLENGPDIDSEAILHTAACGE